MCGGGRPAVAHCAGGGHVVPAGLLSRLPPLSRDALPGLPALFCCMTRTALFCSQNLTVSGDCALEPLQVGQDGVVSVERGHAEAEHSLANLFCGGRSLQLGKELGGGSRRGGRGGRCPQHSLEVVYTRIRVIRS